MSEYLELYLVHSPDDFEDLRSLGVRLQSQESSLKHFDAWEIGIIPEGLRIVKDALDDFIGFAVPLAQAIGPSLGVGLVAWLKARAGRRVRVKFGDIKVEAGTPEELGEVLKRIADFQHSKQGENEDHR